jgi:hypothetical protein
MFDDVQWATERVAASLARFRANAEREEVMLRRSREMIATSKQLLEADVPKVWHPEPTAN